MLNKAILQGRLVADPELRHTQSGTAVAYIRVASNRNYKSKDPNAPDADFINVVAWRSTAEFISKYFNKGSMILVEGRIQTRDYTDNEGRKHYVTEIVADSVNFCGSKSSGTNQPTAHTDYQSAPPASASAGDFAELADDDDELPF